MKKFLSCIVRVIGILSCAALIAINYGTDLEAVLDISPNLYVREGSGLDDVVSVPSQYSLEFEQTDAAVSSSNSESIQEVSGSVQPYAKATIKLFGIIPIKEVNIYEKQDLLVIPGGEAIGVTLYTDGVLVVGTGEITSENQQTSSPAAAAGIVAGDIITYVNGIKLTDSDQMSEICEASEGSIDLAVIRNNQELHISVNPVVDVRDGVRRMGLWVRDSTSGIGTLSFYQPDTKRFCVLGHAVTDVDTNTNITVSHGEIIDAEIVGITAGQQGKPGELKGVFSAASKRLGQIDKNSDFGLVGTLYETIQNPLYPNGITLAYPDEVTLGDAQLLTTIDGAGIMAYDCKIIKLFHQDEPTQKGIIIEVTDEDLISKTGGIIQGMSGSPIIQNGKLVGVVTHVFLNNPRMGYGIYSLWINEKLF